jgi:hypothetical protein
LPAGFQIGDPPTYYDISTTASYSGVITVCISYVGVTPAPTALLHYQNGAWVDITTSIDPVNQKICGVPASLSPFALVTKSPPVVDTVPPRIVHRVPTAGATEVSARASIKIVLSEPVRRVSSLTVRLVNLRSGATVRATVRYNAGTRTITLYPRLWMYPNSTYRVEIRPGISDRAGNRLPAKSWKFRTGSD